MLEEFQDGKIEHLDKHRKLWSRCVVLHFPEAGCAFTRIVSETAPVLMVRDLGFMSVPIMHRLRTDFLVIMFFHEAGRSEDRRWALINAIDSAQSTGKFKVLKNTE